MLKRLFLHNGFLLSIISLNAMVIFVRGFFRDHEAAALALDVADNIFTLMFMIEALVKISTWGVKGYFRDGWNVFDFILVAVALPSFVLWLTPVESISLHFLLSLRILRVFKFFRVLRFVPNVEHLILGIFRALKSSILIVFAFFIFNFIFAILSFSFFGDVAPEYFSNPLLAFYSTFKVFTIEGWYEIPDLIAERSEGVGLVIFARVYFVLLLFGGGIFGLSLINSIFVESMMSDSTDELEKKVDSLEVKIDELIRRSDKRD